MNLSKMKEVMIICMGSSMTFSRINSATWLNEITEELLNQSAMMTLIEQYKVGGKALIVPVLKDPPKPLPSREISGPGRIVTASGEIVLDRITALKTSDIEVSSADTGGHPNCRNQVPAIFEIPSECIEVQLVKTYNGKDLQGGTFWRQKGTESWNRMELNGFSKWVTLGRWTTAQLQSMIRREEQGEGWYPRMYDSAGTRIDPNYNKGDE